jgi:hypothetical protein
MAAPKPGTPVRIPRKLKRSPTSKLAPKLLMKSRQNTREFPEALKDSE